MNFRTSPLSRTSIARRSLALALACCFNATAIAGVNDGLADSVALAASAPESTGSAAGATAPAPAMPAEWLAKHDVRAAVVAWNFARMPTRDGFEVEIAAHTPAGLQLAVRCENAGVTMDKVKFATNPVDVVRLEFNNAWFVKGQLLSLVCTAGGQRHVERLVI
jgi:hypothetical protein